MERGAGPGAGRKRGIVLEDPHWEVVRFVRAFYLEFNTSPAIRALVRQWKSSTARRRAAAATSTSCSPEGPAKQATKIAGLPSR